MDDFEFGFRMCLDIVCDFIIEELATIIGAKYDFRDFGVEAQYDRAKKFIERK